MLVMCAGGCERTAAEYQALLGESWIQTRIVPSLAPVSVVEGLRP